MHPDLMHPDWLRPDWMHVHVSGCVYPVVCFWLCVSDCVFLVVCFWLCVPLLHVSGLCVCVSVLCVSGCMCVFVLFFVFAFFLFASWEFWRLGNSLQQRSRSQPQRWLDI